MNRIGILLALFITTVSAKETEEALSLKSKSINVWNAVGPLGVTQTSDLDTFLNKFHTEEFALHRTISLQNLGNAGTPAISRIFSDRIERSDFLFFQPYSLYYTSPEDLKYFNTKTPYSNITYSNGGLSNRKQEHISGIFTVNINPHFNLGMYGKWQNNFGSYDNQSTKNYNAGFFGSYINRHHEAMANVSFNGYRAKENGGILNTEYITDPKSNGKLDAYNVPTFFDEGVESKLVNRNIFFNYKYHFGFDKSTNLDTDSTTTEFVPVSSIIYSFKNESDYKRYKEAQISNTGGMGTDSLFNYLGFATNHFCNNKTTYDSVSFRNTKHVLGLTLNEEFNAFGKFGLAGYLTFNQKNYSYLNGVNYYNENPQNHNSLKLDPTGADSLGRLGIYDWETTKQSKVGLGATISKRKGEHLRFNFNAEYYFKDEKNTNSSFNTSANVATKFNIGRNIFAISANASHAQYCPDFFEDKYFSNRIQWHNDFENKKKTTLNGTIGIEKLCLYKQDTSFFSRISPELGLIIKANQTTLSNHVYWGTDAMPHQHSSNISITSFTLQEKFKIWILHFDNELTIQQTSTSANILDIPTLCLYSNLYLKTKPLFNVLTLQLGADMRYNTLYFAPDYLPSTGMFFAQNKMQTGDYPFYDAYISMHLKTFRVFLEYNHINHIWSNNNHYLVSRNYAYDPDYIRFGISVNFAN